MFLGYKSTDSAGRIGRKRGKSEEIEAHGDGNAENETQPPCAKGRRQGGKQPIRAGKGKRKRQKRGEKGFFDPFSEILEGKTMFLK